MVRPVVLMAEKEPPEGLSARKLVLETGRFNVITAYSVEEALDTLTTFPRVNAVVLHAEMCTEVDCDQVVAQFKKRSPKMLVIALSPTALRKYKLADHNISSHEPQELLNLLRSHFGDLRTTEDQPPPQPRA